MAPPVRAGLRGHRDAWRAFGAFRPEFSLPLCGGVFTLGPSGLKLSLSVRPPGSLSELEAGSASSAPTAPPCAVCRPQECAHAARALRLLLRPTRREWESPTPR